MDYAIDFAIVTGIAGGALGGYFAARSIWRLLARRSTYPRLVAVFVALGCLSAAPIGLLTAFVAGGTLGGGWGDYVLGTGGVPIGLAFGIATLLAAGLTVGAAVGGLVGYAVSLVRGALAT